MKKGQNLLLNSVPFNHQKKEKELHFIKEKKEGFYPIFHYKLSANAKEILSLKEIKKEIPLYINLHAQAKDLSP
ncbi:hypothetical protein [Xanthovirga aplysinae]|uniref:hypothetical protein n=1 Tax=Xanthovirga aplysinae TaxID=2529853 RepID=UPI0012BC3ED8|nr:hypothetical protein [Xanthovirga aplysinae]MTI30399.1 hypothetical protein [Xanthovirga aplysinae]